MNRKILTGIGIVALLVGIGAYVMYSKSKSGTSSPQSNGGQQTAQTSPKSLKDLLAAGVPQKCTYKDTSSGTNMEGTSYISGGKVRTDFTSEVEGKTTTGHSIFDGKASYVWMEGESSGFKTEVNTSSTAAPETSSEQGMDLNKTLDYSCGAWLVNESLFTPPSDVVFTSFAAPTSPAGSSTSKEQDLCESCNSLSGEQKAQCLSALNCN